MALLAACLPVWAQSIVRGRVIAQDDAGLPSPCPEESICMDSWIHWTIKVTRTLSGTPVEGHVRAVRTQHDRYNPEYQARLRLFILEPITDANRRKALLADFYLIEVSTKRSTFCTERDPSIFGLREADARRTISGDAVFASDGSWTGKRTERCFKVPARRQ